MTRFPGPLAIAALSVALGACSAAQQGIAALGGLQALAGRVRAEFREPGVAVKLHNSRYLTISLVNSKRADAPACSPARPLPTRSPWPT